MDSKTENLLKKLECKECGNYMCPPIRMCINRHSYCDLCFKKVTRCPECRGQKSTLRNHTFENIVHQMLFPCKYVDKGCGFLGNWNEIASHKDCDYGAKPCPFAIVTAMPCNWKGNRLELKGHMDVCQFSRYCSDAVPYRSLTRNSRQCYGRRLIMVYDQFFVVCWCKTGDFLKFFVYTMFGNVCALRRTGSTSLSTTTTKYFSVFPVYARNLTITIRNLLTTSTAFWCLLIWWICGRQAKLLKSVLTSPNCEIWLRSELLNKINLFVLVILIGNFCPKLNVPKTSGASSFETCQVHHHPCRCRKEAPDTVIYFSPNSLSRFIMRQNRFR